MLGVLLKRGVKFLAILAPFLAPMILKLSLYAEVCKRLGFDAPSAKEVEAHEQATRAAVSSVMTGAVFVSEMFSVYLPKIRYTKFAHLYVTNTILSQFEAELRSAGLQCGIDIRVNMMLIARPWWTLWMLPMFEWFVHEGFDGLNGRQADLRMALCAYQGIAGQAVRKEALVFRELPRNRLSLVERYLFRNTGGMTFWQIRKTQHVLAILSIPMRKELTRRPNARYKTVGVINIDAISSKGLDWLKKSADPNSPPSWISAFWEHGTTLAVLR